MTAVVRLRIPAKPEFLVLGRLALSGLARVHGLSADDVSDLKLALTEACTNAVRHAHPPGEGTVEIWIEVGDQAVAIEVLDEGPGFERPGEVDGDLEEGGLGLSIIDALADELEIGARADGMGSRLRFRMQLSTGSRDEER